MRPPTLTPEPFDSEPQSQEVQNSGGRRPNPPLLSSEQRRLAFDRSLSIRRARAEAKQGLAEYDRPAELLAFLWEQEPIQGMQVVDLLTAMRGFGLLKARRLLDGAGIKPNRCVRGVGPRQRDRLFELLAR